jgi:hypothetical protein
MTDFIINSVLKDRFMVLLGAIILALAEGFGRLKICRWMRYPICLMCRSSFSPLMKASRRRLLKIRSPTR